MFAATSLVILAGYLGLLHYTGHATNQKPHLHSLAHSRLEVRCGSRDHGICVHWSSVSPLKPVLHFLLLLLLSAASSVSGLEPVLHFRLGAGSALGALTVVSASRRGAKLSPGSLQSSENMKSRT